MKVIMKVSGRKKEGAVEEDAATTATVDDGPAEAEEVGPVSLPFG